MHLAWPSQVPPIHITINRYNFQSLSVYPRVSSSLLTVASSKLRACGIGGYEDTVLNPSCLMHSSLPFGALTPSSFALNVSPSNFPCRAVVWPILRPAAPLHLQLSRRRPLSLPSLSPSSLLLHSHCFPLLCPPL